MEATGHILVWVNNSFQGPRKEQLIPVTRGKFTLHPNFEVRKWEEESYVPTGNILMGIYPKTAPCNNCGEDPQSENCWLCRGILKKRKK